MPVPAVPGQPGNVAGRDPSAPVAQLLIVQLELDFGAPERYVVPLAFVAGREADDMKKWHGEAVVADLRTGWGDGVLVDGVHAPAFVTGMADVLARRRMLAGAHGQVTGLPAPGLRRFGSCLKPDCPTTPISGEQSNCSVLLGDQAILKFIRRFEEGVNPGVELGRFLSERAHFPYAPRVGGSIEYRGRGLGTHRRPSPSSRSSCPTRATGGATWSTR